MPSIEPILTALAGQADGAIRTFMTGLDIKSMGLIGLVALVGIVLFDLVGFGSAFFAGRTYTPLTRTLAVSAARTWEGRDPVMSLRGGRTEETLTETLDALAEAVLKWDDGTSNVIKRVRGDGKIPVN